jgi:hypothetical protein
VATVVNSSGQNGRYGWQDSARVVPAYALTQGRTRSAGSALAIETLVTASEFAARHEASLQMESQTIVALAAQAISVAEIGAALHVPIGVAKVLVSDLAEAGYLIVSPPLGVDENGRPSRQILERLLDGLRAR